MKFFTLLGFLILLVVGTNAQASAPSHPASKSGFHWPSKATPTPSPRASSSPKKAGSPTPPPRAIAAPTPMTALPNYDEATSTRLQIFLDNHNFGPGKIDGKMGEF